MNYRFPQTSRTFQPYQEARTSQIQRDPASPFWVEESAAVSLRQLHLVPDFFIVLATGPTDGKTDVDAAVLSVVIFGLLVFYNRAGFGVTAH